MLPVPSASLSTCDIADALIAASKGIVIEGTKERDRLIKSLLWMLQQKRGTVAMVGRIKGAGGGPMLWQIALEDLGAHDLAPLCRFD